MATLAEMAGAYRAAAVKVAMRLREKETAGADPYEIRQLRAILADIRLAQRCLSGYYDVPRPPEITVTGMKARGASADDH